MGALTGPEPAQGGPGQSASRGQRITATWPARPPGPVSAGEGRGELKRGGPGSRPRVKRGQAPPGAANRPDISPVSPRNAVPDRAPGMIEGHPWRTAPFLTRDREAGVNYGSICSIYSVRFAGSGEAVARLTRDHGPSATGTITRSGTGPLLARGPRLIPPCGHPAPGHHGARPRTFGEVLPGQCRR
jgi:hypothetical protein